MRFGTCAEKRIMFDHFKSIFRKCGIQIDVIMATPAGQAPGNIFWIDEKEIWSSLYLNENNTAWRYQFGVTRPDDNNPVVTMDVQVNVPVFNGNHRGALIINEEKNYFFAHRGSLGGGHNVVTIDYFIERIEQDGRFCTKEIERNGNIVRYVLIGNIYSDNFIDLLKKYVDFCRDLRNEIHNSQ